MRKLIKEITAQTELTEIVKNELDELVQIVTSDENSICVGIEFSCPEDGGNITSYIEYTNKDGNLVRRWVTIDPHCQVDE